MNIYGRKSAVFYTCATCNLHCRYCSIDKNPALKEIDKLLEESFKDPNYYFERVKKYFPVKSDLEEIQMWGGEPTLYIERLFPLLHKLINYYPNLFSIYHSTNMVADDWADKIVSLFNELGKYPNRDFFYCLQLSCDGPEYINDAGRGKGTTKRSLKSFNKLIQYIKEGKLPDNIKLDIAIKPTLDIKTLKLLNTEEKIIEYYQFFETNWLEPVYELKKFKKDDNYIIIPHPVPNMAVPCPATKEDGIYFAQYEKMCRDIEALNSYKRYFKYYTDITMFKHHLYEEQNTFVDVGYSICQYLCGMGSTTIGFLPQDKISVCHEGFTCFLDDYKVLANNSKRLEDGTIDFDEYIAEQRPKYMYNDKDYEIFEKQIHQLNIDEASTARIVNIASEIMMLAMADQVSKKYLSEYECLRAAQIISRHAPFCFKSNFNITGTLLMMPFGDLRLFCNGALDYIDSEGFIR